MRIIYSDVDSEINDNLSNSCFMCGPTPRSTDVPSWRPDAIDCFEQLGYDGHLIVPEPQNGVWKHRDAQIDWEQYYLDRCDVVMFWVPRNMVDMPGLTTNIEFGMYMYSERIVFGAPPGAENVWYMQYCCEKIGIPISTTLLDTCRSAMSFLNRVS